MKQSVLKKWIKYSPDTGDIFWNRNFGHRFKKGEISEIHG